NEVKEKGAATASVPETKMQENLKPVQAINAIFASKLTVYSTVVALLMIMSYVSYQHAKNSPHPVEVAALAPKKEEMAFTGVFVSGSSTIAIINQQSYHLGDTVNGMKILAINQDSVDLQRDDKVIKLKAGVSYLI